MPYQPNIPLATDLLSQSQLDIQTNFSEISTLININHGDFNTVTAGKHKFLQMPEQAMSPVTIANEGAVFVAVGANSLVSELNFKRENLAAGQPSIAFTEGENAANGWSRLPSGIMIRWKTGVIASGVVANNILFAGGTFPGFVTCYNVLVTTINQPNNNVDNNCLATMSAFTNLQVTILALQRTVVNTYHTTGYSFIAFGV